ncbi:MAG: putative baseplate assembly protein [Egibacteraceae bacterium]
MTQDCGCCAGVERLTPAPTANPPGLDALPYRVGTHGGFLETMLARLSSHALNGPLRGLRARTADDPSIALLDAWATVADVLTFYQERIANEGYLRTATERRSVLELARLIGYQLRPGLAATTYLAYTLDVDPTKDTTTTIPRGSRAQSVPGPGELPQSFETTDDLEARASWNILRPRTTQPTVITRSNNTTKPDALYATGISTGLKPNDRLLFVFGDGVGQQVVRPVVSVTPDPAENRTAVALQVPSSTTTGVTGSTGTALDALGKLLGPLAKPTSRPPTHPSDLDRDPSTLFALGSDVGPQLLATLNPAIEPALYQAWANATVTAGYPPDRLQALRVRAAPFGATAPLKPVRNENGVPIDTEEWPLGDTATASVRVHYFRRTANAADLELTSGGQTVTTTVPLDETPDRTFPLQSLGTVRVQDSTVTVGELNTVRTLIFTFAFAGGSPRAIIVTDPAPAGGIASGAGSIEVGFSDATDGTWRPDIGQTFHRTTGTHRMSVVLDGTSRSNPGTLSASHETLLPLDPRTVLPLDAVYDQIVPGSWVVVERAGQSPRSIRVTRVETVAKAAYNISATVSQLTLAEDWLDATDVLLSAVRETTVYAQSEQLELAPEPRNDDVKGSSIDLDKLYQGLQSGRWLIVAGERTDIPGTTGVNASELVMLAGAVQAAGPNRPGDTSHTTITLAKPLAYTYKRDTVKIYGNVVKATHGETSGEALGSGDGSKALQAFTLRRSPLTYLASATPSGAESALEVRVDEVRWHEADSLVFLGPTDHAYVTRTDDRDATTVMFGDGVHGARLPTGAENVRATYRTGIGRPGNVQAEQISQLQTRPLGVNGVTNPLRASGGADRDSLDQARRNAPLAVLALDRLVSVQDYADFARARAGIGKATSGRLSDGTRTLVHVTIAGVDDIPIDETSDLFESLRRSLSQFGDPSQPVEVKVRELALIVIAARVRVDADHRWDLVEPKVRAALLSRFSFDRREFGQDVVLSEVISTIQGVSGVVRVVVDGLTTVPERITAAQLGGLAASLKPPAPQHIPLEIARPGLGGVSVLPAQLGLLSPKVPDTLILKEMKQ